MRQLGWLQIEMVEVQQRRLEVRRERVGIVHGQAMHGVQNTAANVDEAMTRLRDIEGRFRSFHGSEPGGTGSATETGNENGDGSAKEKKKLQPNSRAAIVESLVERKVFKEGNLIHKTEQEVKTHTSYLVFAVLPVEWSEEDEEKAAALYPVKAHEGKGKEEVARKGPISNRQAKRDAKAAEKARLASLAAQNNGTEGETNGNSEAGEAVEPVTGDDDIVE
jgi:tRNA (adenine57-N1/adenine58-N1)-methyltransferase